MTRRVYTLQIESNDPQQMQVAAEYVARAFNDKTEGAIHSLPAGYHLTAYDVPDDLEVKEFAISSCMNLSDVAHALYILEHANDFGRTPWAELSVEQQAQHLIEINETLKGRGPIRSPAQGELLRLCVRFLPAVLRTNVMVNVAVRTDHPQLGTTTVIEQRAFEDLKTGDVFAVGEAEYRVATSDAYPNYAAYPIQWQIDTDDLVLPGSDVDLDLEQDQDLGRTEVAPKQFESPLELMEHLNNTGAPIPPALEMLLSASGVSAEKLADDLADPSRLDALKQVINAEPMTRQTDPEYGTGIEKLVGAGEQNDAGAPTTDMTNGS